jgi:hypothetical protein
LIVLNVESVLKLMEDEATEAGIATCPVDDAIYARREIVWIMGGQRVGRGEVERTLRERSGLSPEVVNAYKRG